MIFLSFVLFFQLFFACSLSPINVIIDTDIGSDIDDTFALLAAIALKSKIQLLAVSTVGPDARRRAMAVQKLFALTGIQNVPVFAGFDNVRRFSI